MSPLVSTLSLAALLCAAFTTGLPSPLKLQAKRVTNINTTALTVPVVWYQAPEQASATTCGFKVSDGSLKADNCYTLYTAAVGIQQNEEVDCVFKVWDGVSDCSGDGSWTETVIPCGNSTTCIYDNVLDGGNFQHKSGIYTCS